MKKMNGLYDLCREDDEDIKEKINRECKAKEIAKKVLEKEIEQLLGKIKPIRLGKSMSFKYIPFAELIEPRKLTNFGYDETIDSIPFINSRALNTIKNTQIRALEYSIRRFGLLNPLQVVDLLKTKIIEKAVNPDYVKVKDRGYEKIELGRYAIIDGQRRYYSLKRILTFPTLHHYVLIPCIVYKYETVSEMMRHSIEDNRFAVIPSNKYLEIAERKGEELANIKGEDSQKIYDLNNKLWKINDKIDKILEKETNKIIFVLKKKELKEEQERLKKRLKLEGI